MILNDQDSTWAMNYFIEYFGQFERIDQYLKEQKLEQVKSFPFQLPGMADEDDFFSNFDLHPHDMKFSVTIPNGQIFDRMLNKTSSHTNMSSIPGKSIRLLVTETTTNTIVGFIRLGSPVINSKPRNDFLGRPLQTTDLKEMGRFNASAIMGFVIVPTQPFGYNYLGGKLLAAICCSHHVRDLLNSKYNTNICLFETTSLYGTSKSSSMYDGMKPFLRFIGLTDSDFVPSINDDKYAYLKDWFENKNNGVSLVHDDASSRKLKTQHKMISIIRNSLDKHHSEMLKPFKQCFVDAKNLTEQKRQYLGTYGFKNVKEYLNLETDTIEKNINFDRFEYDSIITWWKKHAGRRYEKLKNDNRLRTELEVWSKNSNIDIIR